MALARIIRCVGDERSSVIGIDWVTGTLVLHDILTFLVQAGASRIIDIVIAGLALQWLTSGLFITACVFQKHMRRNPTLETLDRTNPWKQHLYSLYTISGLILLRSVFLVIQ
ncbi:hypothetical protein GB937_008748 [Aspergillus fischeri]|nr:hypothetical protein GB937_008748 [Aspergillus fischeri]